MPLQILFLDLLYLHQLIKYLCRYLFLLLCKNMHLQVAFSLSCRYSPSRICICNLPFRYLADTPHPKSSSATFSFAILQILPFKNSHPQVAFSLSCRYSPSKIRIHNLLFLYLADTPLFQHTLLLIYSGFLLNFYFDF